MKSSVIWSSFVSCFVSWLVSCVAIFPPTVLKPRIEVILTYCPDYESARDTVFAVNDLTEEWTNILAVVSQPSCESTNITSIQFGIRSGGKLQESTLPYTTNLTVVRALLFKMIIPLQRLQDLAPQVPFDPSLLQRLQSQIRDPDDIVLLLVGDFQNSSLFWEMWMDCSDAVHLKVQRAKSDAAQSKQLFIIGKTSLSTYFNEDFDGFETNVRKLFHVQVARMEENTDDNDEANPAEITACENRTMCSSESQSTRTRTPHVVKVPENSSELRARLREYQMSRKYSLGVVALFCLISMLLVYIGITLFRHFGCSASKLSCRR